MDDLSIALMIAIGIISVIIVVLAIYALIVSIKLAIKYMKYNKQMVKSNKAGHVVAEELLKKNNIKDIKVKKTSILSSFMFGNSYSHYFKRIRLRGLIYDKPSLTSVALAGQKVELCLLDKEGDKDMKRRIRLLPVINFGPFAWVLLILIGFVLDFIVFNGSGWITLIFTILGTLFYLWTFQLQLAELKTETKAQDRALKTLKKEDYLTDNELEDAKKLYELYNLSYKLSAIIALLQMIKEILTIILKVILASKSDN